MADALAKGGKLVLGGQRSALGGTFFEPTVMTGVTQEMKLAKEETFAPLAPIIRFKDENDVIAMANDTEFGLASYFYSRDMARVWRVAEALESGMVGVNTGLLANEAAPFGGVKQSGWAGKDRSTASRVSSKSNTSALAVSERRRLVATADQVKPARPRISGSNTTATG